MRKRETPDIATASDDYARRFAGRAGEYLLSVQRRSIERALRAPFGHSVLDVGGGHGQLVTLFLERGDTLTLLGSDASCHRRVRATWGERVACVTGDVVELPFADRSVDVVIAVRLIAHVDEWHRLIAEFCRVARHAVVIDFPSLLNLNLLTPLLFRVKKGIERNTRPYYSYTQRQLAAEFARHGFRITAREPQFFLPMALHRLTKGRPALAALESVCRAVGLTRLAGSPVILRADRHDDCC